MALQAKLLRGGSWFSLPGSCRSAFRSHLRPVNASYFVGFRVACLSEKTKAARPVFKLLRGGSWSDLPRDCRSAYRDHLLPVSACSIVGFRVVCLPSLTAICQNDDLFQTRRLIETA
jgi:formylglycine-generating enzyme required for sulfatase activity